MNTATQKEYCNTIMVLSFVYRLISRLIATVMAFFQFQTEEQVLSLKLLVNTETNKVLFAEAGKDFMDILCSFLTFPLGTIARLVQEDSEMGPITIGCLSSLNRSVEKLGFNTNYNSSEDYCGTLKINIDDTHLTKYYVCTEFHGISYPCSCLSIGNKTHYCSFWHPLSRSVSLLPSGIGFVKATTSFVISDDLIVSPHSMNHTIFDITKKFRVKNASSVKEVTVNLTKEKVLDLLKCSFFSKTPLTDLFIGMEPIIERSRIFSCDVKNIISGDIHITVKIVVRKSDNIILYAQGKQDFADLIIRFLTFPLGGVLRKLEGNNSSGSIEGLCKSVADLNEDEYFINNEAKNRLLHLSSLHYYCHFGWDTSYRRKTGVFLQKTKEVLNEGRNLNKLNLVNTFANPPVVSPGSYAEIPEMYIVTDDLVIEPLLSPVSSVYQLNRFKTSLDDLEEKVVTIGIKESLGIFREALNSTSALTNGLRHLLTQAKKEK
ncbi:uncharacterized protein LOC131637458 [Vicia villosa]|uniref:uncharacterized protein LOC131637458 n=1 Tax=Vicia villosa TaxID=3911 RepID=UPI00273C0441|nr:uncharacterized protein LOC131637458 [Vicia villosa]